MTRRDIIIIATLVNLGLLAILFMMAVSSDDDKVSNEPVEIAQVITEVPYQPTEVQLDNNFVEMPAVVRTTTGDEVDNALKEFASSQKGIAVIEEPVIDDEDSSLPTEQPRVEQPRASSKQPQETSSKYVEVTVKRGDTLEKIARANGTTISAIKEASQLKNDRLTIGQILRVPVSEKKSSPSPTPKTAPALTTKAKEAQVVAQNDAPQYYSIRAGDNPWKIAKQFHLKVDDLLSLNHLDEEKARNLKVGDKIRVR